MTDSVADRARLVAALRAELVGPAPAGQPIDTRGSLTFGTLEESYGPFVDTTGEEILSWDRPVARYGVGVLFPSSQNEAPTGAGAVDEVTEARDATEMAAASELISDGAAKEIEEKIAKRSSRDVEKQDELDLSATTSRRPSSMGLSFLIRLAPTDELLIEASGGRYDIVRVAVGGREGRRWFVRRPWTIRAVFPASGLVGKHHQVPKATRIEQTELEGLDVDVSLFTRDRDDGSCLITMSLINRTVADKAVDRFCLFQVEIRVSVMEGATKVARIEPYPTAPLTQLDAEEQSLSLLYRGQRAFAVGHGCSADWDAPLGDRVSTVIANVFPVTEIPSITPDISDALGQVTVPMRQLAGLDPGGDGAMKRVIDLYAAWIDEQRAGISGLPTEMQSVAARHLIACDTALHRMRRGLDLVLRDADVGLAFRLANHAMLLQQIRSETREPRRIAPRVRGTTALQFSQPFPTVTEQPSERRGAWRPFQIAFILMSLASVAEPADGDRERVELIWFPTGGGKTEAYLGLTAFSLFLRRLRDPKDVGVDVLMRYTLRLLTAQQFQRASTLICAMDYLRRKRADIGEQPFTIGIWLGGDTTPNKRKDAYEDLQNLRRPGSENPFLLTKCPWCAAQIGPVATHGPIGYQWDGTTVRMRCSDRACDFSQRLPVLVIDEDLYAEPPSMVIGTVDKFAMLAWLPEARALFGFDLDGVRRNSPPNMIIQDELHLISGPLGTMVGLYESVVEELCTDRRGEPAKPKIITSTATARRFKDQVRSLFARTETTTSRSGHC